MRETRYFVLCGLCTALMIIGGLLRIPFLGSSFTLQVMVVIMTGLLLGPKWGAASAACYLALGLVGLPIFTKGGGPAYVLQYEFGYLLGFIFMAFTAGWARARIFPNRPLLSAGLATGLSIAALYVVALPYIYIISVVYTGDAFSISSLFSAFCLGFLPMDAAKGVLAVLAAETVRSRLIASGRA